MIGDFHINSSFDFLKLKITIFIVLTISNNYNKKNILK